VEPNGVLIAAGNGLFYAPGRNASNHALPQVIVRDLRGALRSLRQKVSC